MTTTIKITQLSDIGANLTGSTILPVVNMTGTPVTQKTSVSNMANVILSGAGTDYAEAGVAGTVSGNIQPNITSVGTLIGLTVSNSLATVNLINTSNVSLGAAGRVHITGGANGQVLTTNGLGNLVWANATGIANTGNITFNDDVIASTNDIVNIVGNNYAQLESANTYIWVEDGEADIEVNGNRWVFDNAGNLTLPANEFSINYANGDQVQLGANTGNISFNNNVIYSNSGVVINNSDLGNGQTAGMSIPLQGDGNSVSLYNTYGNVTLLAGNIGNSQNVQAWSFGADGGLTFPYNYYIGPGEGSLGITSPYAVAIVADQGTTNQLWLFGTDGNLTLPNDANIAIYGNTTQFNTCPNGFLGLNSYDAGSNNIARVNISSVDELVSIGISNPITEIDYNWTFATGGGTIFPTVSVQRGDNPSGTITGQTLLFGDSTQEAIISTPDGTLGNEYSQRLVINPGKGYQGGEGGDIYLWAGRGGNASGSGGDIKIRGGQGGANTVGGAGGSGGYIRMEAGDAATTGGYPGYIDITGGYSNTVGGYVHITGGQGATVGGDVKIYGGYGTATGGNVDIWGGASGNGQANEGHVNIETGGNTWTFDAVGNLTLPSNTSSINYANGDPYGGSGGANTGNVTFSDQIVIGTGISNLVSGLYLAPSSSSANAVQYLRVRGDVTYEPTHIHFDTGNNQYFNQFIGDDNKYVLLSNTGNIVINTDDYAGNSAQWIFDTSGNLSAPGNISATGNVTGAYIKGNGSELTNVTVSVAGNIVGTQSNVTLVAGSYTWTFNNTGNLTLPGNTFSVNYANNTPVNVVTRFEGAWTVPTGNSTQSFTVSPSETYYMWVDCNIPNGILVWNATGTVTNTNVPVVGTQYAWVYNGGGTPIDFTSIPNQFIGTANAIVRSNVAPSSTTNRFDFGINNTSGGNVTVRYGWIAIS